jgi:amidase
LNDEIIYASVATLAHAIRTKTLSAAEVVGGYLQRIEQINPLLNAIVQRTDTAALAHARAADAALARGMLFGPLHGVPMTIKDSLDTAGVISSGGTQGRATYIPTQDATVVARLRAAGAILLGKTNTPELTLAFETDNLLYGRTNNPYNLRCSSGGSSGGAAAIIAAGGSPFDIGSDTGGSIRLPAHFCGIAGLRPTNGRVPRTGHILPPIGALDRLTQLGPLARFVGDLAILLPIISGPDWHDAMIVPMPQNDPDQVQLKELRVAFHSDNGIITPTPETISVVRAVALALQECGMSVVEDRPHAIEQTADLWRGLFRCDGGSTVQRLLALYGTTDPHPWLRLDPNAPPSAPVLAATMTDWHHQWSMFCNTMLGFMELYDLIVCPVCAFPAIPHGTSDDPDTIEGFSYTKTYNLTGWPCVTVRCGTSPTGLPIGIQIVAHPWREDVALAVARYLESVFGGWQRSTVIGEY